MGFDVVIQKEMRLTYCQTVGLPLDQYLFENQSISPHARGEIPLGTRYHLYIPDQSPYSVPIPNQPSLVDNVDEINYETVESELPTYEQAIFIEQNNQNKV